MSAIMVELLAEIYRTIDHEIGLSELVDQELMVGVAATLLLTLTIPLGLLKRQVHHLLGMVGSQPPWLPLLHQLRLSHTCQIRNLLDLILFLTKLMRNLQSYVALLIILIKLKSASIR